MFKFLNGHFPGCTLCIVGIFSLISVRHRRRLDSFELMVEIVAPNMYNTCVMI